MDEQDTPKYGSFHDVFQECYMVFWDDSILYLVYVKNKCPYHAIKARLHIKCGMATFLH
jgi:hypothetical protein